MNTQTTTQIIKKLIDQIQKNKKDIITLKAQVTKLQNQLRDGKTNNKYSYFEEMPQHEKEYFITRFNIGMETLTKQLDSALDWLRINGKTKNDYRAFMRKWLSKHYEPLSEEQMRRNAELRERVQAMKKKLDKRK